MKKLIGISVLLFFVVVASACSPVGDQFIPDQPVDSGEPIPVEPDGGIGDSADPGLQPGNVYLTDVQLMVMESYPVQVALAVTGDLPTPCYQLRYSIADPDAENQILVDIFSEVETDQMCIEVLEPFSENISLPVQDLPDGKYKVFVNGELIGEFSYPG